MISEVDKSICKEEVKFESYFKKIVILNEEGRRTVDNYKEFLEEFSMKENTSIKELESIFISFIRCIAMMRGISIEVFNESDNYIKEKKHHKCKTVDLDNLESIINIIESLDIARILVVY